MKNFYLQSCYSFRATFMRFRKDFNLTHQQFFFLWYLFKNKFTEQFRTCDLLVPGATVYNSYYFVKVLRDKGYLKKKGFYYILTDKARENFKKFFDTYERRLSLPFTWK